MLIACWQNTTTTSVDIVESFVLDTDFDYDTVSFSLKYSSDELNNIGRFSAETEQ